MIEESYILQRAKAMSVDSLLKEMNEDTTVTSEEVKRINSRTISYAEDKDICELFDLNSGVQRKEEDLRIKYIAYCAEKKGFSLGRLYKSRFIKRIPESDIQ